MSRYYNFVAQPPSATHHKVRESVYEKTREHALKCACTHARETRREKEKRGIHRVCVKKCERERNHERESLRERGGQKTHIQTFE